MKFKTYTPEVPKDEPFKNDLLGRKKYADMLTQYIQNTEGGFTLSLNASWGNGKTTFIKMWEAELQNLGYPTIYFNAWETDYAQDPFLALIDGIIDQVNVQDSSSEKKQLLSSLVNIGIGILKQTDRYKLLGNILDVAKNGVDSVLEDKAPIHAYQTYSQFITEFREKLEKVAEDLGNGKQLIFFVDELDRCRPDYAVEMLERIKHFFSIDKIVFVLSIDKEIIKKATAGVYNCDTSDAENYLRRFIDLDFDLPEPTATEFVDCLYKYHDFETVVGEICNYWDQCRGTNSHLEIKRIIAKCFSSANRTLRDIEKFFNRLDIVLRALPLDREKFNKTTAIYLVYLYLFHKEVYDKIRSCEYSSSELLTILEDIFAYKNVDTDVETAMLNLMLQLLLSYEEYVHMQTRNEISLSDNFHFRVLNPRNFFEGYLRNKGPRIDATSFCFVCPIIEMVSDKYGER